MKFFGLLAKRTGLIARPCAGISNVLARGWLAIILGGLLTSAAASDSIQNRAMVHYDSLPLAFEVNHGQAGSGIKFLARANGYTVFLKSDEALVAFGQRRPNLRLASQIPEPSALPKVPGRPALLELRFAGTNPAPGVAPLDETAAKSNYFLGGDPHKWLTNVPTYARVKYQNLYPGIDLVCYGSQRQLEFDFVLAPGADLRAVKLQMTERNGRVKAQASPNGDLLVRTAAGEVRFRKPRVYQMDGSAQARRKHLLQANYVIAQSGEIGFDVEDYDHSKPLVVDPVLSYSTYLGGTGFNQAYGIAVDASGSSYITGYTTSADFPDAGGVQGNFVGGNCDSEDNTAVCFDAFVAKLNPQGTGLIYSTYLGGSGDDRGIRVAVDSAGETYIAGYTSSPDFPTAGPIQASLGAGTCGTTTYPTPCYDAFIAKLNASGSSLIFSTYLGGTGNDFANSIAVDSSGSAYVTGMTSATDFPITSGALQTAFGGGPFDGFVAKINSTGTSLVYSTYLGGSGEDHANDIAVDASGEAYITGQTNSSNFPVQGGFQAANAGGSCGSSLSNVPCFDAFVSKLNATGSALVYSSYLGGTGGDYGIGIALDPAANAYVTGWTTSKDFPVTASPYEKSYSGSYEAFAAKVNTAGSALSYATYLGDINPDVPSAIVVDAAGDAYIAGYAYGGSFPVVSPLQTASGGFDDAFVAELNPAGSNLIYSTYIGGSGDDFANGIALDSSGNLYVAGATFSTDFPTTPSAFTTAYTGGSYDAWIAKISPSAAAGLTATPDPVVFGEQGIQSTSAPVPVLIGDAGSAPLNISNISVTGDFAETNSCGGVVQPGTTCPVNVTFAPTAVGTRTGTMTLTDTAAGSPHVIPLTGYGTSGTATFSATSLNFGPVLVGTTSGNQSVTLTNSSATPLNISSIQAQGDFTESNSCGSVLNAGASCTISVSFSPVAVGLSVGSITITDSAIGSPHTITLTGTGAVPAANLSATSLAFPSQGVGTTSPPEPVTLSNTGQVAMSITSVTITGNFAQTNNCGTTLAAGASCTVNVTFTPQQTGAESGTLEIADNAAGSPQIVSLSGTGTISVTLTAQQTSVKVLEGADQAQFTLTASVNGGPVTPVVLGCENIAPATCSFNPATLSPGGSSTLTVGNLGQVNSMSLNFSVTGTVAPSGSSSPPVGSGETLGSSTGTVTATLPLTVEFEDFTISASPSKDSIQAGQTATYTVTLAPVNGFNLPVSLGCQGAPAGATCSVSQASVNVTGSVNVKLTVSTTARSLLGQGPQNRRFPFGGVRPRWLWFWCFGLGLFLALLHAPRRSPRIGAGIRLAALAALVSIFLVSCGGGGGVSGGGSSPPPGGGTAVGTYTLTVQGTAQSLTHSTAVTLQVN